jgi:hypothetical protein
MSKTKLHKIIKKYNELEKQHRDSWNSNKGTRTESEMFIASYNYMSNGNKLFESLVDELNKIDIFKL